jgi:hypothetical protein
MSKIFAAALLATSIYAGAASAHGGGGAEPMPGISFTDMPDYPATPINRIKSAHKNSRWHRGFARDH